jgi:hypothetical protein
VPDSCTADRRRSLIQPIIEVVTNSGILPVAPIGTVARGDDESGKGFPSDRLILTITPMSAVKCVSWRVPHPHREEHASSETDLPRTGVRSAPNGNLTQSCEIARSCEVDRGQVIWGFRGVPSLPPNRRGARAVHHSRPRSS